MIEKIAKELSLDVEKFIKTGDMTDRLYEELYSYYVNEGEMPYEVAKARSGDPYEWVCINFEDYLGVTC